MKKKTMLVFASVLLFAGITQDTFLQGLPGQQSGEPAEEPLSQLPETLLYLSEADYNQLVQDQLSSQPLEALSETYADQILPVDVSLFYPTMGQPSHGLCWMGVRVDSDGNVYPFDYMGNIYRILPDGTMVNGDWTIGGEFFATGGNSMWGELDELSGEFYTAAGTEVRSAPFVEGSSFTTLVSGLTDGVAITKGGGPNSENLFATEAAIDQVSRVDLAPPGVSWFASGTPYLSEPEMIVSSPDGSLYVTNWGIRPPQLTKISPAGTPSLFAIGSEFQTTRALIVDPAGNVYWSHRYGFDKFDSNGNFLGSLPGPPEYGVFQNPLGTDFDSQGNLYVVENHGCKRIFKYTLPLQVAVDIKPGSARNCFRSAGLSVIPLVILSRDDFDATQVDPTTIFLDGQGVKILDRKGASRLLAIFQDENGDGLDDLIVKIDYAEGTYEEGETRATLTGNTFDGLNIQGTDLICLLP